MCQRLVDYFAVVGGQPHFAVDRELSAAVPDVSLQSLEHLVFEPRLEDRAPHFDFADTPFPKMVERFCLPHGVTVRHRVEPSPPVFFGFMHTFSDGAALYGAALQFEEPLPLDAVSVVWQALADWQRGSQDAVQCPREAEDDADPSAGEYSTADMSPEQSSQPDSRPTSIAPPPECVLYTTRALCILSHSPYYSLYRAFLTDLHLRCTTSSRIPLERYILNLMRRLPDRVPRGQRLEFHIASSKDRIHLLDLPSAGQLPPLDVPLQEVFELLSIESIMTLFTAMLLERKLLFVSEEAGRLCTVIEALCGLLFPFQWLHVKVPLLPGGFQFASFIDAPVPFLMGVTAKHFNRGRVPEEVVVVRLDEDAVELAGCNQRLPALPALARLKLLRSLRKCLLQFDVKERRRGSPTSPDGCLSMLPRHASAKWRPAHERFPQHEIREVFLKFFVKIFRNYRKHLRRDDEEPFRAKAFIAAQPKEDRPFFAEFLATSAFEHFVDSRLQPDPTESGLLLFDECVARKEQQSRLPLPKNKKEHPLLEPLPSPRTVLVAEPLPQPGGALIHYSGFPRLQQQFFESLMETPAPEQQSRHSAAFSSWTHILSTLSSLTAAATKPSRVFRLKRWSASVAPPAVGVADQSAKGSTDSSPCSSPKANVSSASETFPENNSDAPVKPCRAYQLARDRAGNVQLTVAAAVGAGAGGKAVTLEVNERCPKCSHFFAEDALQQLLARNPNPNNYLVQCPKCETKWVPHIILHVSEQQCSHPQTPGRPKHHTTSTWSHQYILYSPAVLGKEVLNLQRREVMADGHLSEAHPQTFWNLFWYLSKLKMPLGFVLPQVDWAAVVHGLQPPNGPTSPAHQRPPQAESLPTPPGILLALPLKAKTFPRLPLAPANNPAGSPPAAHLRWSSSGAGQSPSEATNEDSPSSDTESGASAPPCPRAATFHGSPMRRCSL